MGYVGGDEVQAHRAAAQFLDGMDPHQRKHGIDYLAPEGRVLLNDPQAIGLHDL